VTLDDLSPIAASTKYSEIKYITIWIAACKRCDMIEYKPVDNKAPATLNDVGQCWPEFHEAVPTSLCHLLLNFAT